MNRQAHTAPTSDPIKDILDTFFVDAPMQALAIEKRAELSPLNPKLAVPQKPATFKTVVLLHDQQGRLYLQIEPTALEAAAKRYYDAETENRFLDEDASDITVEGVQKALMIALAQFAERVLLGDEDELLTGSYSVYKNALIAERQKVGDAR